ncbi:MAG: RDD family protein [Anaerolineae bacterium]|nr:RDD family protein [Anaerolineae bacterium]
MMPPDRVLSIDTPENVVFGYELLVSAHGFWRPSWIRSLLPLLFILDNHPTRQQCSIGGTEILQAQNAWVFAIFVLPDFIIWAYYIVFELVWNGQSPGKRLTKLRVMQAEGRPVTLTGSMLRNLVRFIDFLPIFYGVGVIAMFISKQSRRLGDFAGGTLVVYDHSIVSLHQLAAWQPSVTERLFRDDATQQLSLPIEKLDASDIALAEELLLRGPSLTTHNELAASVLRKLYADMDVEMDIVGYDSTMKRLKGIVLAYRHLNEADYEEVSAESGSGVGVGKANP